MMITIHSRKLSKNLNETTKLASDQPKQVRNSIDSSAGHRQTPIHPMALSKRSKNGTERLSPDQVERSLRCRSRIPRHKCAFPRSPLFLG
jgi:hypothetical protein